jgi:hypothetical protein
MNAALRSQTWVAVVVLVGLLLGCRSIPPAGNNADRVYAEYDRAFQTFLAKANGRVGKEVIKVERLSDQFTVPQKLAIKGTPYEIGLILGYVGQEAQIRLPMLSETNRALNQKVMELYQNIYPQ